MTSIILELTPELAHNLEALLMAGAKNPATGADGIMGGAQLLQLLWQARQKAQQVETEGAVADAAAEARPGGKKPKGNGAVPDARPPG